jgi:hypothetical protein
MKQYIADPYKRVAYLARKRHESLQHKGLNNMFLARVLLIATLIGLGIWAYWGITN